MAEATITIGKTKIHIRAEGCHDCGTWWSSSWHQHTTAELMYRTRKIVLNISICADCWLARVRRSTPTKEKSNP